jgi:hypothetical protein
MLSASINPDNEKERSAIAEGVSGRDCECVCCTRNALASSASNSLCGKSSFSMSRCAGECGEQGHRPCTRVFEADGLEVFGHPGDLYGIEPV